MSQRLLSMAVVGAGMAGRASSDRQRPSAHLVDDRRPEARTRGARQVVVGPQVPHVTGGYPTEAPGVGGGNAEMSVHRCRASLDQIAGTPDPLPRNAGFADAPRTV